LRDIPELPHYMSVAQAAQLFGISKTSMYYKIYDQQKFKEVYRVGGDPEDEHGINERPFLLIRRSEVLAIKEAEDKENASVEQETPAQRLNSWNRRVKEWGRRVGTFGEIFEKGRPTHELIEAYQQAHPNDPRPV